MVENEKASPSIDGDAFGKLRQHELLAVLTPIRTLIPTATIYLVLETTGFGFDLATDLDLEGFVAL